MIVSRGYGRPKGITISGGFTVSAGFGRFIQSFITTLRMRVRSVEYVRNPRSIVEGRDV